MDPRLYSERLHRRIWLLIALPLLAGLIATFISIYHLPPVYEASTTLWLLNREGIQMDYGTYQINRGLVKTYSEVALSRTVIQRVIHGLQLERESVESIRSRLRVRPVRDTDMMLISVQDYSPQRAASIADTVAQALIEEVDRRTQFGQMIVMDPAEVPRMPVAPLPVLNGVGATVLGALLAAGIAAVAPVRRPRSVAARADKPASAKRRKA